MGIGYNGKTKSYYKKSASPYEQSKLYEDIQQNFLQMRNYCIESNIRQIFGIMTNFQEWIFTYYDLVSEGTQILKN